MSKDSKKDNGDLPTGNFSSNEKTQSNIKAFIDLVPADEQIIQNYIRSLKQKLISLKSASKRHSTAAKSHHHASSSRPAINHSGQPCQQDSILNCLRNNLKARKSVCQYTKEGKSEKFELEHGNTQTKYSMRRLKRHGRVGIVMDYDNNIVRTTENSPLFLRANEIIGGGSVNIRADKSYNRRLANYRYRVNRPYLRNSESKTAGKSHYNLFVHRFNVEEYYYLQQSPIDDKNPKKYNILKKDGYELVKKQCSMPLRMNSEDIMRGKYGRMYRHQARKNDHNGQNSLLKSMQCIPASLYGVVCDNQEKRVSAVGKRKLGWYNSCKNKPKEEEQRCSQNPISRTESAINPMLTADWNFTAAKAGKIGDLSTISMHKETIYFLGYSCMEIKEGLSASYKKVDKILDLIGWKANYLNTLLSGKTKRRKYEFDKLSRIFPKGFFG